jgi:long-chain acyl-CoA synthetase
MADIEGDSLLERVRRLPPDTRITINLTAAQLCARAGEQAAAFRRQGVVTGEAIALQLPNCDNWVLMLLALLAAGTRPLLVAPETPEGECARLLAQAGARRWLAAVPGSSDEFALAGEAGTGCVEPGVLIPTSGSTGEPKLVSRTERSLIAEGVRYRGLLSLGAGSRVLLPLPLNHAYALGWLAGTLVAGAELRVLPPTALSAITADLRERATHVALVPTLARLLAARQLRRGNAAGEVPGDPLAQRTLIVMVGAGPVDSMLDETFQRAFGIATARNYGSSETGAVFAGLPPLPPLCVGQPMPGVEYRIVDSAGGACTPGVPGSLQVRLDRDQGWHDMGDVAQVGPAGLTILGRKSSGIRRGGQWVAPLEVEAVLREHEAVNDARVRSRPGRFGDEDVLIADVEVADPSQLQAADLVAFARQRLAHHKVPHEIRLHRRLPRTSAGKVAAPRRYRLATFDTLVRAARAYRISELLFSLLELGALPLLAEGAQADDLASELGLPLAELDWLLSVACWLGLVEADTGEPAAAGPAAMPFVELEGELSRSWVTRAAITGAVREGLQHRPFERAMIDDRLCRAYGAAMHDATAVQRARLGLRMARQSRPQRVVEVSGGPGRYLDQLLAGDQASTGYLVQLGRLAGQVSQGVAAGVERGQVIVGDDPPAGEFDLCIIANGIHGPAPGDDLGWLLNLIRPDGAVLIDDVFLPRDGGPGSELGLDWLTHGGMAWPHAEELIDGLVAAGQDISVHKQFGTTGCHLILARQG